MLSTDILLLCDCDYGRIRLAHQYIDRTTWVSVFLRDYRIEIGSRIDTLECGTQYHTRVYRSAAQSSAVIAQKYRHPCGCIFITHPYYDVVLYFPIFSDILDYCSGQINTVGDSLQCIVPVTMSNMTSFTPCVTRHIALVQSGEIATRAKITKSPKI